jgi:hypothetical protein
VAVVVAAVVGLIGKRIRRNRRQRQADDIVRQDFPHPPPASEHASGGCET